MTSADSEATSHFRHMSRNVLGSQGIKAGGVTVRELMEMRDGGGIQNLASSADMASYDLGLAADGLIDAIARLREHHKTLEDEQVWGE